MIRLRKKLVGNSDICWVVGATLVCALFVAVLLRFLSMRHVVYQLGYELAALTHEHSRLLEENRRLVVEAAVHSNEEQLESRAIEMLGLRPTVSEQVVPVAEE